MAAIVLSGFAAPLAASEVEQSQEGTVHRLAPAEAEAAKEAAASRNRDDTGTLEVNEPSGPRIHGEMGFAVGTGGYTSVFGAAVVPLGENGVAAFSFERSDFGNQRYRYRR